MKEAIRATYDCSSSDDNPQHESARLMKIVGASGAKRKLLMPLVHPKTPDNPLVLQFRLKICWEDCQSTYPKQQRLNKFTYLLFDPKQLHSGASTVEIATFLGVIIFSEGCKSFLTIWKQWTWLWDNRRKCLRSAQQWAFRPFGEMGQRRWKKGPYWRKRGGEGSPNSRLSIKTRKSFTAQTFQIGRKFLCLRVIMLQNFKHVFHDNTFAKFCVKKSQKLINQ